MNLGDCCKSDQPTFKGFIGDVSDVILMQVQNFEVFERVERVRRNVSQLVFAQVESSQAVGRFEIKGAPLI